MNELFFELIRVALGNADRLSHIPKPKEWQMLYDMAKKQSLVGICFAGVQKASPQPSPEGKGEKSLPSGGDLEEAYIPEMLYLTWMGMAAKIQQRNEVVNQRCINLQRMLCNDGISNCVLKGQGIAALYECNGSNGSRLRYLRQSGDIDVWCEGGRERIYKYSMEKLGEISGVNYHHIHFPVFEDTEVEMHIYPSFLSSPLRNKRLQEFCKMYAPSECKTEEISTPSLAFNLVFIMLHCYRHLSGHGVGLRQVMDFYFVLKSRNNANDDDNDNWKSETMKWVKRLGMGRFAPALMWVMKEVFGMDDEYLICEPNEKDGRFLLSEIMQTGNMGHADERVDRSKLNSALGRYIYNFKRDLHVMRICPHEALWEPWFNLVLYLRRKFIWSRKYNLK